MGPIRVLISEALVTHRRSADKDTQRSANRSAGASALKEALHAGFKNALANTTAAVGSPLGAHL